MAEINYTLILIAVFFAATTPGPATLAIAGTSMSQGRLHGSILVIGISSGGFFWSCSAAFGLSTVMYTNVWLFELIRYVGGGYLLFMAYQSTCAALSHKDIEIQKVSLSSLKASYYRGLALNLTNPKSILFFASLYAVGVPAQTSLYDLTTVIFVVALEGFIIFQTLVYIFSISRVRNAYVHLRRYFEAFFAIVLGFAGFKILTFELD